METTRGKVKRGEIYYYDFGVMKEASRMAVVLSWLCNARKEILQAPLLLLRLSQLPSKKDTFRRMSFSAQISGCGSRQW